MEDIDQLIKHVTKHIELSEEDKEKIKSSFTPRTLRKRELLIQQGVPCMYENYIVQGTLRGFFVDDKGDEHTLQFAVDDWWMSDIESFTYQTAANIYAEALEPTRLLQINKPDLDKLYHEVPMFERFFRILHQRACIAQSKRILNAIRMNGMERYLQFIENYPAFHQKIPQKYIASYLGITPVFLSQIRKSLATKN